MCKRRKEATFKLVRTKVPKVTKQLLSERSPIRTALIFIAVAIKAVCHYHLSWAIRRTFIS